MKTLTLSLFLILSSQAQGDKIYLLIGKVVGVPDGDTVWILDRYHKRHKVRLQGIDAPELHQAFGAKSKQSLSSMIKHKTVKVTWSKRGHHGRMIGNIYLEKKDINLEQIKRGFAWHYKRYAKEQTTLDQKLYSEAEQKARVDHLQLWQDKHRIEPWLYRQGKRRRASK